MSITGIKIPFYEEIKDNIRCKICPHNCIIGEDKFGICRVRTVKSNVPVAINYGEVTSMGVDLIEKKPLYHFKPSKDILSLGSFGCNMTCSFCQNYEISQGRPKTQCISVESAEKAYMDVFNNEIIISTSSTYYLLGIKGLNLIAPLYW